MINSAAKSHHSSATYWLKNVSKDGSSLNEIEWKKAIDSLKIQAFITNPNLFSQVFRGLMPDRQNLLYIQDL